MLFRKKITRACSYCERGTAINEEKVLCIKRGIVSADSGCRKFKYNPYKRIPPKMKALDLQKYNDTDFTL